MTFVSEVKRSYLDIRNSCGLGFGVEVNVLFRLQCTVCSEDQEPEDQHDPIVSIGEAVFLRLISKDGSVLYSCGGGGRVPTEAIRWNDVYGFAVAKARSEWSDLVEVALSSDPVHIMVDYEEGEW
jgi:hypothetical protein